MEKKTCFVISPIGDDGSDIRNNANALFDLIIQPAIEIFNFNIVRADKIMTTSAITDDIVKLVQNSELCIIDATGRNPNVFYEAGRRHETAKPFIQMKKKGEILPFDIQGIRTLDYDISDVYKVKESADSLRNFVKELEQTGYGAESSSASLTSIATTLTRIERKIETLSIGNVSGTGTTTAAISGSPTQVFYDALNKGDNQQAMSALKKFMQINHDVNLHLSMASSLVDVYEPSAIVLVRSILDQEFDSLTPNQISITLFGLYTYYFAALTLKDEYSYIKDLVEKTLKKDMSDVDKAALYNVSGSLEYGLGNDTEALKYWKKTIEYNPAEPAYYFNISKIYNILSMKEDLIKTLTILTNFYQNKNPKTPTDIKYLNYARDLFSKNGNTDKVNEIDAITGDVKK
ncbi:MAG: hypothetical protein M3Z26_14840 [Bacteroidota bacterium]|nr:hypothetical protein [Bacteroidota bacterium]